MAKTCEICGSGGNEELIINCYECHRTNEHTYCMVSLKLKIPSYWCCNGCEVAKDTGLPHSGDDNVFQTPPDTHQPLSVSPKKVGGPSGSKKYKADNKNKMQLISSDEVIRLSLQYDRKGQNPQEKSSCPANAKQWEPSRSKDQQLACDPATLCNPKEQQKSSRPSQEVATQKKHLPASAMKKSTKEKSVSVSFKDQLVLEHKATNKSEHKKQQIPSVKSSQEVVGHKDNMPSNYLRTNDEANTSQMSLKQTNYPAGVYTSEIITSSNVMHPTLLKPAGNQLIIGSGKTSKQLQNFNSKVRSSGPCLPVQQATWEGGFKFFDTFTPSRVYGGFQAWPSCRIHRKAYHMSESMPTVLGVDLLPCSDVFQWSFQDGVPDFRDLGLYFFASDKVEGSTEAFASLFDLLETKNVVMRSRIGGVELLVFTSSHVCIKSEGLVAKINPNAKFLCGVFHNLSKNNVSGEPVDMVVDMVGGKSVGRDDIVVQRLGRQSKIDRNDSSESFK